LNARLDALEDLHFLVSNFIETINQYFSDKKITFNIIHGFQITHNITGESIGFNQLSSGEKQILLLLSNTITVSDSASIFIMDEPEISLNVKWQRRLIKTLLDMSMKSHLQFIIATHSVELITTYQSNVIKLVPLDG